MQNSTLRTKETGRNLPLKFKVVWLSPVIGFRYIALQCPAIVCQNAWNPLALVPLYHSKNISVKSFTGFVTDFADIFWENFQVGLKKVDFQNHIPSRIYVRSQLVLQNILIVCCFAISDEVLANLLKRQLSISFSLIQSASNCLSCISSLIWGPIHTPSFIFASLTFGIFFSNIRIHGRFYLYFSQSFHEAQLYVQRGQKVFSGRTRGGLTTCSFRPQFIYTVILLVPAVPLTQETAVFCVTELHSE